MTDMNRQEIQRMIDASMSQAMERAMKLYSSIADEEQLNQPLQLLDNRMLKNTYPKDRSQVSASIAAGAMGTVTFEFVRKSIIIMRGAKADTEFDDIDIVENVENVRLADANETIPAALRWANLESDPNIPRYALTPLVVQKNSQYTLEITNHNAGAQLVTISLGVLEFFKNE